MEDRPQGRAVKEGGKTLCHFFDPNFISKMRETVDEKLSQKT